MAGEVNPALMRRKTGGDHDATGHPQLRLRPGRELDPTAARLLPAMPLHAITVMYGEAGLRQRLVVETLSLPSGGRGRVGAALALAARLHAGDRRCR